MVKVKKGTKRKEKNELEELLSLGEKSGSFDIQIPNDTLPKNGILYEKKNNTYLVIKYIGDIDLAKKGVKRYRASIVAERGE